MRCVLMLSRPIHLKKVGLGRGLMRHWTARLGCWSSELSRLTTLAVLLLLMAVAMRTAALQLVVQTVATAAHRQAAVSPVLGRS